MSIKPTHVVCSEILDLFCTLLPINVPSIERYSNLYNLKTSENVKNYRQDGHYQILLPQFQTFFELIILIVTLEI